MVNDRVNDMVNVIVNHTTQSDVSFNGKPLLIPMSDSSSSITFDAVIGL